MNNIKAIKRDKSSTGSNNKLRREGYIPAILYGGKNPNQKISVEKNSIKNILNSDSFLSKVLEIDLSMSGYFIIAGIVFFSGSLFLISIFKLSFMGAIAPIGGLSFILGWITLFLKINS